MRLLGIAALLLLGAARAHAQDDLYEEGCVYEGRPYPEDTEMCQHGNYLRCAKGAWSSEGVCVDEASPELPDADAGDAGEEGQEE